MSVIALRFHQREEIMMEWQVDGPAGPLSSGGSTVTVLRVRGEVDLESGAILREEAGAALRRACEPFPVCVDLRDVEFIDCAGLRSVRELVGDLTTRDHTVMAVRHGRAVDLLVSALDKAGVGVPQWSESNSRPRAARLSTSTG